MIQEDCIQVEGMSCSQCVGAIERKLLQCDAVQTVRVNLLCCTAVISYDSEKISLLALCDNINSLGFRATLLNDQQNVVNEEKMRDVVFCLIFAIPEFIVTMILPMFETTKVFLKEEVLGKARVSDFVELLLVTPIQLRMGTKFGKKALRMLQENTFTMELLILIGTSIAYCFSLASGILGVYFAITPASLYEIASTLFTFITIGHFLEDKTRSRTTREVNRLQTMSPKVARKRIGESFQLVNLDQVELKDEIRILSGECVTVDGVILSGQAKIDESLLTGESVAKSKGKGDSVFAGTVSVDGSLIVKTLTPPKNSYLCRIMQSIQHAQSRKAKTQLLADKIAS